eukprot:Anaeramoba_flamelloidesa103522_13.p1 GENE.a103522_13~~a103522_13.p1  ORF type:complete len:132 (-),score=27.76 a103522_13:225-620(-)
MRGALFGQWVKDKNPFQLRVKPSPGEIFFVEVSRQMKVKEVKVRIGYRYSSPFNEIQAIHSEKILVNEKTIEEYGINEQAFVIILIKKPKNPQLMLHTFGMGSLYVKIRFDQTLQELKKAIKKSEGWEIKS